MRPTLKKKIDKGVLFSDESTQTSSNNSNSDRATATTTTERYQQHIGEDHRRQRKGHTREVHCNSFFFKTCLPFEINK